MNKRDKSGPAVEMACRFIWHSSCYAIDELKLCDIMRRGLVEAGYAVDTACDGGEGRELAEMSYRLGYR